MTHKVVFQTERLSVRVSTASDEDVDFLYALWTNRTVMRNVGFPCGLQITRDDVKKQLEQQGATEYDVRLLVFEKTTGRCLGECKLGLPGEDGISETDVKLLPEFWGNGYGTEIKRALVDYLFTHTDCKGVRGTPNRANIASQKMQEAVGGRRVGEGVFVFPAHKRAFTEDVPYYEYLVTREDWETR